MVRDGNSRVWGEGVTRTKPLIERDGGKPPPATTDSSTRQQYRAYFCTLKHTISSKKPVMYLDSGLDR